MNLTYEQLIEKLKSDLAPQIFARTTFTIVLLALVVIVAIWVLCAIGRVYGVWSAHKAGEADLARARNDQQIQVAKAQGRLDAAELNKRAEIVDAEAVAKGVEIIGTALHNNHGYLQWKWIHMMEERDSGDTIYVPTEAGLPILEAGNRKQKAQDLEEGD